MSGQNVGSGHGNNTDRRRRLHKAAELATGWIGSAVMFVVALYAFNMMSEPSRTIFGLAAFASFLLSVTSLITRMVWGLGMDDRFDRIDTDHKEIKELTAS